MTSVKINVYLFIFGYLNIVYVHFWATQSINQEFNSKRLKTYKNEDSYVIPSLKFET